MERSLGMAGTEHRLVDKTRPKKSSSGEIVSCSTG
jgi:hypothetical protein